MRPPNICNEEERLAYIPYLLAQEQEKHDRRSRNEWVDAARCGDLDRVKSLRDSVDDINGFDAEGETALGAAAGHGHLHVVHWLVGQGAWLNVGRNGGMTPLMMACIFSQVEVALWLITQSANVLAANAQGLTALHYAAEKGDGSVVHTLLANGAHPDGASSSGVSTQWAPIQGAVRYGHLETTRLLRETGAKWPIDTPEGWTLLHLAAHSGNTRLAQWLLVQGHNELETTDQEGQTPADIAGWNGHETLRRYLAWRGKLAQRQ